MLTAQRINKLGGDAQFISRLLDTALQHKANAEVGSYFLYFHRLALVDEGRTTGDDKQIGYF